jgi:hypothetical protein
VTQTAGLPSGSTFPVGTTTNTFEAEDGSGNISTCSFDVTVLDAGPNVDATTTTSGMDTITANNATATSYQWIDCGTMTNVAGETSQEFVATYNGSFAVVVTEGACSDTSACVDINGLGVESAGQHINFKMYPNPTNGNFTLEFANNVERINVEITDVAGRNVHSFSAGNMSKFTSSFNGADGLYFVKITADGKVMFTTLAVE